MVKEEMGCLLNRRGLQPSTFFSLGGEGEGGENLLKEVISCVADAGDKREFFVNPSLLKADIILPERVRKKWLRLKESAWVGYFRRRLSALAPLLGYSGIEISDETREGLKCTLISLTI